jgi:hypothetical protein
MGADFTWPFLFSSISFRSEAVTNLKRLCSLYYIYYIISACGVFSRWASHEVLTGGGAEITPVGVRDSHLFPHRNKAAGFYQRPRPLQRNCNASDRPFPFGDSSYITALAVGQSQRLNS